MEFEMQVGDQVIIKADLSEDDDYPCGVTSEMVSMAGQICTVKEVLITENLYQEVLLEEDENYFRWSTPMFEGLASTTNFSFIRQNGNVFKLRDGKMMLRYKNSIISPNGFAIGVNNYDGSKHKQDANLDIVAAYAPSTDNYKFNKGECLWEEEVVNE